MFPRVLWLLTLLTAVGTSSGQTLLIREYVENIWQNVESEVIPINDDVARIFDLEVKVDVDTCKPENTYCLDDHHLDPGGSGSSRSSEKLIFDGKDCWPEKCERPECPFTPEPLASYKQDAFEALKGWEDNSSSKADNGACGYSIRDR